MVKKNNINTKIKYNICTLNFNFVGRNRCLRLYRIVGVRGHSEDNGTCSSVDIQALAHIATYQMQKCPNVPS
jgi:hypothetical protein